MLQYGAIATMDDLKSRLIDSARNALAQRLFMGAQSRQDDADRVKRQRILGAALHGLPRRGPGQVLSIDHQQAARAMSMKASITGSQCDRTVQNLRRLAGSPMLDRDQGQNEKRLCLRPLRLQNLHGIPVRVLEPALRPRVSGRINKP